MTPAATLFLGQKTTQWLRDAYLFLNTLPDLLRLHSGDENEQISVKFRRLFIPICVSCLPDGISGNVTFHRSSEATWLESQLSRSEHRQLGRWKAMNTAVQGGSQFDSRRAACFVVSAAAYSFQYFVDRHFRFL
jgi:hypothetical protein